MTRLLIFLSVVVHGCFLVHAQRFDETRIKAANGDVAAQFNLGVMYAKGHDVPRNEAEAVKWYLKAAEQNYAVAQYNLGSMYANGAGVPKDEVEAVKWWKKAAEQNVAAAQNNLGSMYGDGLGIAKDEVEAVKWYRKAADQDYAAAQNNLGFKYANGEGVAKDAVEAVKWWRKAAEQNDADAQYNLGLMCYSGEGVAKDAVEAVKWWRKAAEQNRGDAQHNLGSMYAKGEGTLQDYVEAYAWFYLAGVNGNQSAKNKLSVLEQRMTPEQVAAAIKRAADLLKKFKEEGADVPASNLGFEKLGRISSGFGSESSQTEAPSQLSFFQALDAPRVARNIKALLTFFFVAISLSLFHLSAQWVGLRCTQTSVKVVTIFYGKPIVSFPLLGTTFVIGWIPTGCGMAYDIERFARLPLWGRLTVLLSGPTALFLLAVLILRYESALHHFVSAFFQIVSGALHPRTVAIELLTRLDAIFSSSILALFGVLAAKLSAISLLPFGTGAGTSCLRELLVRHTERPWFEVTQAAAIILMFAAFGAWVFACSIYVFHG